jgi:hypothetical protein
LTLREAKQLLNTLQKHLLQQADAFLAACSTCPDCGTPLKAKGYHTRTFRTLFGTIKLASPRLIHCRCRRRKTTSFRPLTALLSASVAPELLFMETKWASLVSYGVTVEALTDFLPLDVTLDVKTVRHDTLKVAERCEVELGEEQGSFIRHLIPNYGERYRNGEAITTGFVESTVNQVVSKRFCKKQQMQWSKRGTHLLLQTRVKTLNRELGTVFKRWYPGIEVEELSEAA